MRWNKKTGRVVAGLLVLAMGTTMAVTEPELPFAVHIIWDGIAWALHGFGAAPLFKLICQRFSCFAEWL